METPGDDQSAPSTNRTVNINNISSRKIFLWILFILLTGGLLWWVDTSIITGGYFDESNILPITRYQNTTDSPHYNHTDTTCPVYFQWIYEDLQPWNATGITREMIKSGKEYAHFRVVIVQGKLYIEHFKNAFQTRDLFTIWGFVQLLRLYPGKVPDLELVFGCEDRPAIDKRHHPTEPPPLFIYSGHKDAYGVVFPDWSFWGWPEVNLSPWTGMLKKIKEGSEKKNWTERIPYAYWKGNSWVGNRRELMKCKPTKEFDWNARLYEQDWEAARKRGYTNSKLEDQCTHRYKIYIEGNAWSVSEKYTLACGSTTLFIRPNYYDFFTRGLEPMKHFWPVRVTDECRDIKFAVAWGNNHKAKAQAIGEEGARFTQEQLKMELVYDYMLHLLQEYARLLKFKPSIEGAEEISAETMSSKENGLVKEYMKESMVKSPTNSTPCTMPRRFEPVELQRFLERQENARRQVEKWESSYRKSLHCWRTFFWKCRY